MSNLGGQARKLTTHPMSSMAGSVIVIGRRKVPEFLRGSRQVGVYIGISPGVVCIPGHRGIMSVLNLSKPTAMDSENRPRERSHLFPHWAACCARRGTRAGR